MPLPSFGRPSPRPEDSPASVSSSRFGALHNNVRSMIMGSSIYSNSPTPSNNGTPKIPFLGFLRREQTPSPIILEDERLPRESTSSRSPILPQHTAGSYMRAIAPIESNPIEPHPAHTRGDSFGSIDPETEHLADEVQRRQRRHRRRRKPQRQAWVRRKAERGICFSFVQNRAIRSKCMALLLSGLFLMIVLAIYLSLALTQPRLGQEIHVLFIMIILCTTIFFCHSLIRLCMLALRPESEQGPSIPSMTGPEGFHPVAPIRVHLARDEEMDVESTEEGSVDEEKAAALKAPPPAYGLWRSSVRVNPDLLHWRRVDDTAAAAARDSHTPRLSPSNSRNSSFSGERPQAQNTENAVHEEQGPRPPSYVSDDGVEYVVTAAPRSVAPSTPGLSEIHPAWRPGFAI